MEKQQFVARDRELALLDSFIKKGTSSQGMVCFISGEAGSGKTALITEFSCLAQKNYANLAVAIGQCNAQTGEGDAYLPFREILGQLTGDVEDKLTQGVMTPENASRLRKMLSLSGEALVEVGPDLIGVFIPGAGLIARVGVFGVKKAGWIEKLELLGDKQKRASLLKDVSVETSHIFEQYANVISRLSKKHPLLLMLDDLQWADTASIGLLFHLARRIQSQNILIVGTYRPEEVSFGRAGQRHPLEKVLNETKRYYGDIWVDLDKIEEAERKNFIRAFLDTESNQFDEEFSEKVYQHTGGNPLFTIEFLRNMQERCELIRNQQGRWIASPSISWESLPVMVEGVIEERISRLSQEQQNILSIASVEGADFTAEVIGRVQKLDVRGLVTQLSTQLERQHRLVKSLGVHRLVISGQLLSQFRFQHNLIQAYLYNSLGEAERFYFHEDIGNILEEIYGNQIDEVVLQLAHHFEIAGVTDKARKYLRLAGIQAASRFANDEAENYFSRSLELTPAGNLEERIFLLFEREQIHSTMGDRSKQADDLKTLDELVQILGNEKMLLDLTLRRAIYANDTSDFQSAVDESQKAISLANNLHATRQASSGYFQWGAALRHQGQYEAALKQFDCARSLAHSENLLLLEANSLAGIGIVHSRQGDVIGAKEACNQALKIYKEIGDLRGEADTLQVLCGSLLDFGDYAQSLVFGKAALQIYQRIGYKKKEGNILSNLGIIYAQEGNYPQASDFFKQSLDIARDTGDRSGEAAVLNNLSNIALRLDNYLEASEYLTQVLTICRDIGNKRGEGIIRNNLGGIKKRIGEYSLAKNYHEQALVIFREIGDKNSEGRALFNLADIYLSMDELSEASTYIDQCEQLSREINDRQTESDVLDCSGVLALKYGDFPEAKTRLEKSLKMIQEMGDRELEAKNLADLSLYHYHTNDVEAAFNYSKQALLIYQELNERFNVARTLYLQGLALYSKKYILDALDSYRQSLSILRDLGQVHLTPEPLSGMAQIYFDQGRNDEVQTIIDEILLIFEHHTKFGLLEPMQVYLICYRILAATQDPRAGVILTKAYKTIQGIAEKIDDVKIRNNYLEKVSVNQEINTEFIKLNPLESG